MAFAFRDRSVPPVASLARPRLWPNLHDFAAMALLLALGVLLVHGAEDARAPLAALSAQAVSLDPWQLPEYGLRTTLRMFAAMAASLAFTFVVATWAAKSRRAEKVIVPALDILQSVPVLGFISFTVTFFLGLFPGRQLGAECAAVFAIFTSQAWNMAFSFYQSLRTVPGGGAAAAAQPVRPRVPRAGRGWRSTSCSRSPRCCSCCAWPSWKAATCA